MDANDTAAEISTVELAKLQAGEARTRAKLVEEKLAVRRLQQELGSAEECWRIELEELSQRVRVLTHAQQVSRARHQEQSARLQESQEQLARVRVELKEAAQANAELAQSRAKERVAAALASHPHPPALSPRRSEASSRKEHLVHHDASGVERRMQDWQKELLPEEEALRQAPLAVKLQSMRSQMHQERRGASAHVALLCAMIKELECEHEVSCKELQQLRSELEHAHEEVTRTSGQLAQKEQQLQQLRSELLQAREAPRTSGQLQSRQHERANTQLQVDQHSHVLQQRVAAAVQTDMALVKPTQGQQVPGVACGGSCASGCDADAVRQLQIALRDERQRTQRVLQDGLRERNEMERQIEQQRQRCAEAQKQFAQLSAASRNRASDRIAVAALRRNQQELSGRLADALVALDKARQESEDHDKARQESEDQLLSSELSTARAQLEEVCVFAS